MTEATTFWARRKAAVEAEARADAIAEDARAQSEYEALQEEKTDAELLAELDLPEPETLSQGDDFSVFMSKAVPDRLRRRALRVLWRSNPVLANVDALVDYGEDFTDSTTVIENLQTTYQVGKGMLAHIEKLAADQADTQAEAEDAQDEGFAVTDDAEEPVDVSPPEPTVAAAAEPSVTADVPPLPTDEMYAPAPRRMTFTFEADHT